MPKEPDSKQGRRKARFNELAQKVLSTLQSLAGEVANRRRGERATEKGVRKRWMPAPAPEDDVTSETLQKSARMSQAAMDEERGKAKASAAAKRTGTKQETPSRKPAAGRTGKAENNDAAGKRSSRSGARAATAQPGEKPKPKAKPATKSSTTEESAKKNASRAKPARKRKAEKTETGSTRKSKPEPKGAAPESPAKKPGAKAAVARKTPAKKVTKAGAEGHAERKAPARSETKKRGPATVPPTAKAR